jgi:hypothetical protein
MKMGKERGKGGKNERAMKKVLKGEEEKGSG